MNPTDQITNKEIDELWQTIAHQDRELAELNSEIAELNRVLAGTGEIPRGRSRQELVRTRELKEARAWDMRRQQAVNQETLDRLEREEAEQRIHDNLRLIDDANAFEVEVRSAVSELFLKVSEYYQELWRLHHESTRRYDGLELAHQALGQKFAGWRIVPAPVPWEQFARAAAAQVPRDRTVDPEAEARAEASRASLAKFEAALAQKRKARESLSLAERSNKASQLTVNCTTRRG